MRAFIFSLALLSLATGGCFGPVSQGPRDAGTAEPDAGRRPASPLCDSGTPGAKDVNRWNSLDGGSALSGSLAVPLRFTGQLIRVSPGLDDMLMIILSGQDLSTQCGQPKRQAFDLEWPSVVINVLMSDGGIAAPGTYRQGSEDGGDVLTSIELLQQVDSPSGLQTLFWAGASAGSLTLTQVDASGVTGSFQAEFASFDGGSIVGTFSAPFCARAEVHLDFSGANGTPGDGPPTCAQP